MAKYPGGVTVSGYIAPSDTADTYATHKAQFGQGGYRSAIDLTARDAITPIRREEGMIVYIISEKKEYRLVGGILNTNWEEVVSGSGGGTTSVESNYLIVNDLSERDNLDPAIRKIGQICYLTSTDTEYRLVGGILNTNWVLLTGSSGGTSSDGCCNYVIVETLSDVDNYPTDKRFIGLIVYASDVDREFKLVHGTDNINYVEQGNITSTPDGNIINNTTNNYFNTFGCLNLALITESIIDETKDDDTGYTDQDGIIIPPVEDSKIFTFVINKTNYWIDDWVYFSGTTNIDITKNCEVYLELTQNGNTDLINITKAITDKTLYPNFEIYGNVAKWYGYFKKNTSGRIDIKAYETQDGNVAFNINKSVYLFSPNFGIKDGESLTPKDIIGNGVSFDEKIYTFKLASNSQLTIVLARVQVNSRGIDILNYTAITKTMATLSSDGEFKVSPDIFRDLMIDGNYAILINGKDAGATIPPYFYGPFIFKKYG